MDDTTKAVEDFMDVFTKKINQAAREGRSVTFVDALEAVAESPLLKHVKNIKIEEEKPGDKLERQVDGAKQSH